MSKSKEKKTARPILVRKIAAAVLLIAAAVSIFLFRDSIAGLISAGGGKDDKGTPWAFEGGSAQVFAPAGNGLAAASSTGLQILDASGYTVVRHICSLKTPALAASDKHVAAFDIGGTVLRVADFEGNVTNMDTNGTIIAVTMNDSGFMAVTTTETGYKGLVTVYNPALEPIYEWYSGKGYPLVARVSPDGRSMAALTADGDGGHVRIYSLSDKTEKGSFAAPGELLVDLGWMDSGRICAISETRAVFLEDTGEMVGAYDFGGMYLTDYSFGGSGFLTLGLSKYLSASADMIVTVGDKGEPLGSTKPDSALKYLSASGKQVLALYTDELAVYSQAMNRSGGIKDVQSLKKALLRPKGDIILIFTASAQIEGL